MTRVDEAHLAGLLGSAGKSIAALPGAKRVVEQMRHAETKEAFLGLLQSLDLGVEEPARNTIRHAAADEGRWREVHATLLRSAEQSLHDRFSPSA